MGWEVLSLTCHALKFTFLVLDRRSSCVEKVLLNAGLAQMQTGSTQRRSAGV